MATLDKIVKFICSVQFYGPIIIIAVSLILYKLIEKSIKKATIKGKNELEKKKRRTIILLINNIIKYVIAIAAILMILNIYGVNTTSILAGLGIVGALIGLAFQDALKDIISGINIIMDNYYVVGDLVRFNDFTGTVIEFGLKSTKIQNVSNEVLIISNRNIDKIVNLSQKKTIVLIEVPTAYETDHKKVEKALNKVLNTVKKFTYVESDECKYLGLNEFADSSIKYLIQIKCEQGNGFSLKRKTLELIKEEYEKNNIKIPYDQIEVHIDDNV